ncbi:putative conserved secreted protein [Synechococcus sp. BIOS-E4-1]|nr:putative conserved secreted protein [Synechococcus sp. BIOS-E4-1]
MFIAMRFALCLGMIFGSAHGWLASEGLASGLLLVNSPQEKTSLQSFSELSSGSYSFYP